jgi:hypothetical protein
VLKRLKQRGLTLVELLVSLLLLAVTGSLLVALVVGSRRFTAEQIERALLASRLRTGMTFVTSELTDVAAGNADADLLEIGPDQLVYRAVRGVTHLCRPPASSRRRVVVALESYAGLRRPEPNRDSVLIHLAGDPTTLSDDSWLATAVGAVAIGSLCPGGKEGADLELDGVPAGRWADLERGSPVRVFQATWLGRYRARGDSWLGLREWNRRSGWSITQPVLGPLASAGFRLEYMDADGEPTSEVSSVVRVKITFVVERRAPRARRSGSTALRDSLVSEVALSRRLPS